MQDTEKNKIIIKKAIGKVVKKLRGQKSQFLLSAENEISISIINNLEKGSKDPQLTTIFRLAESFNMNCSDFIKLIEKELPEDFHFIEK